MAISAPRALKRTASHATLLARARVPRRLPLSYASTLVACSPVQQRRRRLTFYRSAPRATAGTTGSDCQISCMRASGCGRGCVRSSKKRGSRGSTPGAQASQTMVEAVAAAAGTACESSARAAAQRATAHLAAGQTIRAPRPKAITASSAKPGTASASSVRSTVQSLEIGKTMTMKRLCTSKTMTRRRAGWAEGTMARAAARRSHSQSSSLLRLLPPPPPISTSTESTETRPTLWRACRAPHRRRTARPLGRRASLTQML
mmetsp:Transcript_41334/g.93425  ORF Transcript_41334/g.93425 Transcript_41334/m.93425 type:complete len:260 (-) Transcript_41334:469-1248(-)